MTQERICEVESAAIRVSPFQPRRHFSEESLEELAQSIRAVGLIHPPVVREITSGGKLLYYELIAGERRWRASQKAGLSRLKVLVRPADDEEAARATLIENVQRVDLNPMETAQALRRLIDVFRMTQEEVAEHVGKKRSTVANYLRLLSLPEQIQTALRSGEITLGHAKAILSLDHPEKQVQLHQEVIAHSLSVRDTEKQSAKQAKKTKPAAKDVHVEAVEARLRESLGMKVELAHQGKRGGKLTIHYHTLDDLDRLLDSLPQ